MAQRVILASNSTQRKALFEVFSIPFEVVAPGIDEKAIRDADLKVQAEKIARAKAREVSKTNEGIIIAADTYAVVRERALEKPESVEEAKEMLRFLSGNTSIVYSGFCYLDKQNGIDFSQTAETQCSFRELTDAEINSYVSAFPVLTWSAAFSPAYLYGMTLVSSVHGSLTSFTHGLPAELLVPLLRKSGFDVHA